MPTRPIGIETSGGRARDRRLSMAEFGAVWTAAERIGGVHRDLIHLMMLTGQRQKEVAGMTWGELDLSRAIWVQPGGRNKSRREHAVPLSSLAIQILMRRRDEVLSARNNPPQPSGSLPIAVFCPARKERRFRSGVCRERRLDAEIMKSTGSNLAGWCFHDFRRTVVSELAERGHSAIVLDALLNHAGAATKNGVMKVYQRATFAEPMRAIVAAWDVIVRETTAASPPSNSIMTG